MASKRVRNERVKVFIYSTCIYDTSRCSSDLVPFSCCILHLPQHPPAEGVVGRGDWLLKTSQFVCTQEKIVGSVGSNPETNGPALKWVKLALSVKVYLSLLLMK